jgi:hypothetical protein
MSVMRRFMAVLARWRRDSAGNIAVLAALGLIPLLTLTGAAVDFGMSLYARQRLDAAVQSAAAAAIAQARALRAARAEVSDLELETRGRSRADLVFNAQKPSVRNVRTQFSMTRTPASNTYLVNIEYEAAIGTVFLRLAGMSELNLRGSASASWIARDAVFEERFEDYDKDVLASGAKMLSGIAGWATNGLARAPSGGCSVLCRQAHLAHRRRQTMCAWLWSWIQARSILLCRADFQLNRVCIIFAIGTATAVQTA